MYYRRRQCFSTGSDPSFSSLSAPSETAGFPVFSGSCGPFRYTSIRTGSLSDTGTQRRAARTLVQLLGPYLGEHSRKTRYLAAGIGNPAVTPDSLGPRCIDRLISSPDTHPALFTVIPNVPAKTGIDTALTVRTLAETVRADCIITIDALAAESEETLSSVIQITDQGTAPGSGSGGSASSLICTETMGIPVISVGVPTVIEAGELLVTPADCDRVIDSFSRVLAWGITGALFR